MDYRNVLRDELAIDPVEAPAPGTRDGDWRCLASRFGSAGYYRLLVQEADPLSLWLEVAFAGIDDSFSAQLGSSLGDTLCKFVKHEDAWHGSIELPAERKDLVILTARWLKISDVFALLEDGSAPNAALERVFGDSSADSQDSTDMPTGFEEIGTGEPDATEEIGTGEDTNQILAPSKGFSFDVAIRGNQVVAHVGFGEELSKADESAACAAIHLNLKGKVDAQISFETGKDQTLVFTLEPRQVLDTKPKLGELCDSVGEYLETLRDLETQGIVSPLVFLGIRTSRSILKPTEEPESGKRESSFLFIQEEDEPSAAEVVFEPTIDDDAALEPGRFDDPRLLEPDSAGPLADVILRHPGFSDRRVGQVLTILLSIDYHHALQLMKAAPCVIARAIGGERAATFKRLVDSAGGKILLTEPDRFPPT